MTNFTLGIALLAFGAIGLPTLIQSILRRRESNAAFYYTLMCVSNLLWLSLHALFYLVSDERLALIFLQARLAFICSSSIFTYLFAVKSLKNVNLGLNYMVSLLGIPVLTGIIAVTNEFHGLLRSHQAIVYVNGLRILDYTNGVWFWFHCIACYLFLVLAARLMIQQCIRLPKGYRLPLLVMLCGSALTGVAALVSAMDLLPMQLDIAPVVALITQVLYFYALFNAHSINVLFTSRGTIFENTSYAVFILNLESKIMDYNNKASKIASSLGIKNLYLVSYQEFFEKWTTAYSGRIFEEDSSIITVSEQGTDIHYQITTNDICDSRGQVIGSYVEINNITPMMSLIHKLQDSAYYDQLTGILNRRSFSAKKVELDKPAYYPLGLIAGDVNKLKAVNDTYLHAVGDLLLQSMTEILLASSPEKALWFRVGGDEFTAIVPNTTAEEMQQILTNVQAGCAKLTDPRFLGADIAMAFRMKTDPEQNIDELMQEADRAMYADKRDRRRR